MADSPGACYVYGVISPDTPVPVSPDGVAGRTDFARLVSGDLALLVAPIDADGWTPDKDDLVAHGRVLDAVAVRDTVLPMRFGTLIDDDPNAATEVLADRRDEYTALLDELDGAVQYTVSAHYDRDAVLTEAVGRDPRIAELREQTKGRPEDETYGQRVRLGELVVAALQGMRDAEAPGLLERVERVARAVTAREPGSPEEVLHCAVLVDRTSGAARLEETTEQLAHELGGRVKVRLVGPQAPYDFV